jgi:predicted Rossmann fold flavoprotein
VKKVAIIGAGASGLLCAIFCAKNSLHVELFEQNSKPAKKILVSGNGRCNISNTSLSADDYFTQNYGFVKDALSEFGFGEFKKFCESIGLFLDIKDDGRVYPLSNEAKSVASILLAYAKSLGVRLHVESKVTDIKKLKSEYDEVVVATGSEAASHLGGNRDGLEFAKLFGHNIIPTYPSLVQLHLASKSAPKMSGVKTLAEISLLINNTKDSTCSGDVLFTNYGVSGFGILDISQAASVALSEGLKVDISINLLPELNPQKLSNHISKLSSNMQNFSILEILSGLIPIKIASTLLDELNIQSSTCRVGMKDAKKIANKLLNWRFEVSDTHGFRHAEVAGGGVDTKEIDSKSMQSLKQKNLYFCGEVLDVVGKRGGYNFAFAWASAYLAAKHISNT